MVIKISIHYTKNGIDFKYRSLCIYDHISRFGLKSNGLPVYLKWLLGEIIQRELREKESLWSQQKTDRQGVVLPAGVSVCL